MEIVGNLRSSKVRHGRRIHQNDQTWHIDLNSVPKRKAIRVDKNEHITQRKNPHISWIVLERIRKTI